MKHSIGLTCVATLCLAQAAAAEAYDCVVSGTPEGEEPFPYYFALDDKNHMVGVLDPRVYQFNNKVPMLVRPSINTKDTLEARWKLEDVPFRDWQTSSTDSTYDVTFKARINKKKRTFFVKFNVGGYGGSIERGTCKVDGLASR